MMLYYHHERPIRVVTKLYSHERLGFHSLSSGFVRAAAARRADVQCVALRHVAVTKPGPAPADKTGGTALWSAYVSNASDAGSDVYVVCTRCHPETNGHAITKAGLNKHHKGLDAKEAKAKADDETPDE